MKIYLILFVIVLVGFLLLIGLYRFRHAVSKEKEVLFKKYSKGQSSVSESDLEGLPLPLKKYLKKVGVVGKSKDGHVVFRQRGRIKTGPEKRWTNFRAVQYMTASPPSFIWSAQAYPLFIRDKSIAGKGEVKVNLFGLKNIAIADGAKTDQSALSRCLGELLCYPVGFLSADISWEAIDDKSVKAIIHTQDTQAEGIFYFKPDGFLSHFKTKRYKDESLEEFTGIAENYKTMGGLLIPTKMRGIWNLEAVDFEYFNSELTSYTIA